MESIPPLNIMTLSFSIFIINKVLIKYRPTESKTEYALVQRVVWRKEIVSSTGIDVRHHDKEAAALEQEVGIDVDDGIIAYLRLYIVILLYGEL